MIKVNQELLDLRKSLKERGIESFFHDFELSLAEYSLKEMNAFIEHEGFPSSSGWERIGRIGDLQIPEGDEEKILGEIIGVYEKKGFRLAKFDKESERILFDGQGKREINYSTGWPISVIASVYLGWLHD